MNTTKGTILIVDDESSIRTLLSNHCKKLNFTVYTAENGEKAIQVLEETKVSIIISDIVMPNVDGVELIKKVRSEYPMVRVIMMTGYVNLQNLLICVQSQVDTVIFKPFNNLDEFTEAIENSLKNLIHWQNKLNEYEAIFGKVTKKQ